MVIAPLTNARRAAWRIASHLISSHLISSHLISSHPLTSWFRTLRQTLCQFETAQPDVMQECRARPHVRSAIARCNFSVSWVCRVLHLRSATACRTTQGENSVGCVNWLYLIFQRAFTVGTGASSFKSRKGHLPSNTEQRMTTLASWVR